MDRRYIACIANHYGGGPVGIETIAAALSEERDTLEDVIEPFLMQQGFVHRSPRGRILTEAAFAHIGLKPSEGFSSQFDLLAAEQDDGQ
jgi:Holliday junction DNA helicase RuvB